MCPDSQLCLALAYEWCRPPHTDIDVDTKASPYTVCAAGRTSAASSTSAGASSTSGSEAPPAAPEPAAGTLEQGRDSVCGGNNNSPDVVALLQAKDAEIASLRKRVQTTRKKKVGRGR